MTEPRDHPTVVAISFGNDKCWVLQSLLVQYLRKMFLHVPIESRNTIFLMYFYFLKAFLGRKLLILPSFTAVNLLLKSNQNDSDFTWLELVHTFPCADDVTY